MGANYSKQLELINEVEVTKKSENQRRALSSVSQQSSNSHFEANKKNNKFSVFAEVKQKLNKIILIQMVKLLSFKKYGKGIQLVKVVLNQKNINCLENQIINNRFN